MGPEETEQQEAGPALVAGLTVTAEATVIRDGPVVDSDEGQAEGRDDARDEVQR